MLQTYFLPVIRLYKAASIPDAMHQRYVRGEIKKGDKVALLGLAAGLSVSVQLLVW